MKFAVVKNLKEAHAFYVYKNKVGCPVPKEFPCVMKQESVFCGPKVDYETYSYIYCPKDQKFKEWVKSFGEST